MLAWAAALLTMVLTTDPETTQPLVDSATVPVGSGSAIHIILQRILQESRPPVPHGMGLLTSVPTVAPKAAMAWLHPL